MISPILNMLLGATLVTIGVLAAALAERIRDSRVSRETDAPVEALRPTKGLDFINLVPAPKPHAPRPSTDGAEDVVAALVAAGYKKQIAADAALACSGAERATIEDWTRAALRRCARGMA